MDALPGKERSMEELRAALGEASEAYLIGMSNKGLYKRACRDVQGIAPKVNETPLEAELQWDGEICRLRVPLWESSCTCPSQSVCRHLLTAILWMQQHLPEGTAETENIPEPPDALPEDPLSDLKTALRGISLSTLKSALGSQLRQFDANTIQLEEKEILTGLLPDGTRVSLLYPLEHSVCSCRSKGMCSHKAAVILAWQLREKIVCNEELTPERIPLPQEDAEKIYRCAEQGRKLLGDVLQWGLVRMPESLAEDLEIAAVRCHSVRMANGERALRDIGSRLTDCRAKRAAFQPGVFLQRLCRCSKILRELQRDPIYEEDLGTFRDCYVPYPGELPLLPIGQRHIVLPDYEGEAYYFLNLDENAAQRFLSFSDLRPTFYDGKQNRMHRSFPWGLSTPLSQMMRSKMVLIHAKVSGGKLSSSSETEVVCQTKAVLDCDAVRRLVFGDFQRLAVHLGEHRPKTELEQLCFVRPERCLESRFDEFAQEYRMTLADRNRNQAAVILRYTAQNKALITQLETIGQKMQAHPERQYLLLAQGMLCGGELILHPIDFYDFIQEGRFSDRDWQLPERYASTPESGKYIADILALFDETEIFLCELLQSGIRSAYDREDALSFQAGRLGLETLAKRLTSLTDSIRRQRHSVAGSPLTVLNEMCPVQEYIQWGRERLAVRSALLKMKGEKFI